MDREIAFFQIYYDDAQKEQLYSFAQPYKNYGLTPFFENQVIAEIVPACDAELIGVCSWSLRTKRNTGPTPIILRGDITLTEEKLQQDYDIAVLTPRSGSHKMLHMAEDWHGKVWFEAFKELKQYLYEIGIKVPQEVDHAIYENHFVARRSIYQSYVNECLIPCMKFMDGNYIFLRPSGYARRKRANPEEVGRIKKLLGFEDWPIMPFLLERLFSIWINNKNFKVVNI